MPRNGEQTMVDFALDWLMSIFGASAKKAVVRTHVDRVEQTEVDAWRVLIASAGSAGRA